MKCPKCGYTSFDFLENCKKCGVDLTEVKKRFNIRSILFPGAVGGEAGRVAYSAGDESRLPEADHRFSLPADDSPLPVAVATPAASDGNPLFGGADPDAFTFEEPDAFPLEALMAEAPAGEELVTEPTYLQEKSFAPAAGGNGFDFEEENVPADDPLSWEGDAAGYDLSPDPVTEMAADHDPAVVGELLTFMEEVDRPAGIAAEEAAVERVLAQPIPAAPLPPPSFPVAVAAASLPAAEGEELEDEPLRISLENFDQLDPEREELSLFDSSDPLPALGGEFAAPIEWSVAASVPAGVAPEASLAMGETDAVDTDLTAVEGDPLVPGPGAAPRLAASAADLIILIAIFALFVFAGELALQPDGTAPARPLTTLLLDQAIPYFLVLFCLGFGYFTFFHFLLGQTLGKMLLRLRVETATGEPVTFSRAFLRSTGGLLALLTAGVGYLPVLRPGGRGLNDRLAGTRVVKASERL